MSKKTNVENIETTEKTSVNAEVTDTEELTDVKEEYIVVYPFLDLIDGNYEYKLNSRYPREDISDEQKKIALSEERINQLTTKNNKIGEILIAKTVD